MKKKHMQKSSLFLVVMGGLVAGGLGLSIWGNEVLFEDFAKGEGEIGADGKLSVRVAMEQSDNGIFAVEVLELKQDTIYATVNDPNGNQILRETVERDAYEGYFDVSVPGNYTLVIESSDVEKRFVAGYIGPEPDASKRTLAFVSIYVLVIGLIGIVIAIIFALVKRRR